jgi:D-alanyl-D-alanine carboxypeptidase
MSCLMRTNGLIGSGCLDFARSVAWLPKHGGAKLKITRVNGVAERLQAVSDDLDRLPPTLIAYLTPSARTYNCRVIAGTDRPSVHGSGAAIDINVKFSDYWRWAKPDEAGHYPYKNRIPWEIVEIFEKHGFIWGGKWYHYDTMHFEYRPELLP